MNISWRLVPAYLALVTLALLPLAGCADGGNRYHANYHQTIPVTQPISFSIAQPAGRITIEAWNEPRVQIDAIKSAGSQADLDRMNIAVTTQGNAISVETQYSGIGFGSGGVDYTVHLPADSAIDAHTAAGQLIVDDLRGNVHASTAAGQIVARMAAVGGRQKIDLGATTGQIKLAMPRTSNATIDASAGIGAVRNEFGTNRIGDGSADVTLHTTTGEVRISKVQ